MTKIKIPKIADNTNPNSMASKSRQKRFDFFNSKLNSLKRPIKILDVGGTQEFWQNVGFSDLDGIEIHLLNLEHQKVDSENFKSLKGNATNMAEFADHSYDIVFSNSVIEHLYTWENQVKMANEIRRVAKNYFIQTPNYWFPIEPHFVFPFFQYLPVSVRTVLISNFSLGHHDRYPDRKIANDRVKEVNLLSIGEMKKLFPGADIYLDKFLGFNKSIVAHSFNK